MYELMLDTINMDELTYGINNYPVVGVTSNPSILKKEGNIDVYKRLKEIKNLCGNNRTLHVQVVSTKTEDIIEEAHVILEKLGKDVYIKIPVSKEGLPAIKALASEGVNITATAIYTTIQGELAVLAGAKYIAVYYNRMQNNCINPNEVIKEIRSFIDNSRSDALLLGASFKNVEQVTNAFFYGCQSVTVPFEIIKNALSSDLVNGAVNGFTKDFELVHGENKTMKNI